MMLLSDIQDYPSVGHIIDLLTQFEVVTIFAIAQDMLPTYQVLQCVCMCMCMCVCMCMCMCTCVCAYMCGCVYLCVLYVCVRVCLFVCIYVCVCCVCVQFAIQPHPTYL